MYNSFDKEIALKSQSAYLASYVTKSSWILRELLVLFFLLSSSASQNHAVSCVKAQHPPS